MIASRSLHRGAPLVRPLRGIGEAGLPLSTLSEFLELLLLKELGQENSKLKRL
jgi:hypothetical protein